IEFIANIHPAIGFANEKMNLFLATDLVQTKQNKDADEFIDLMPANLEKALELVWSNKITDVKTIIGILWFQKICNND
ncbi:ADP-ribose pyrophosphatase, partial [bacterium]|nr:ADP-ribose pyrophosphatase [bacterium]